MAAIDATGLTKSYGDVRVLAGVDLTVPDGSVFALLGPNGAGKTTTVRILSTLAKPDEGRAVVAGFDAVRDRHEVRRRISLTGQGPTVDELQTGEENLRMMGRLSGLSGGAAKARARELLDRFGLADAADRRVSTYSGGMRRKLDLAASLVFTPAVLFLDEPTTGLDPRSRQAMWEVINGLTETGVTIFLTTQYLEEADQMADQVAVLDHGEIVAEGDPAELKARVAGHRLELALADPAAFHRVVERLGDQVTRSDEHDLTVSVATDGDAAHLRALLDDVDPDRSRVRAFEVHSATLDDVFLALTGRAAEEPAEGKDA